MLLILFKRLSAEEVLGMIWVRPNWKIRIRIFRLQVFVQRDSECIPLILWIHPPCCLQNHGMFSVLFQERPHLFLWVFLVCCGRQTNTKCSAAREFSKDIDGEAAAQQFVIVEIMFNPTVITSTPKDLESDWGTFMPVWGSPHQTP